MKKFTKICLITCLILAIMGIAFCTVGAIVGVDTSKVKDDSWFNIDDEVDSILSHIHFWYDFDDDVTDASNQATSNGEDSVNTTFDGIKNLDVSLQYGTLKIQESDEKDSTQIGLSITYNGQDIEYGQDGDTLKIEDTTSEIFNHNKGAVVTLTIPSGEKLDSIDLEQDAGQIVTSGTIYANNIDMDLDAGRIKGGNYVTAQTMTVTTNAGEINLESLKAKNLSMNCDMGSLKVDSMTVEQKADVSCDMGEIDIALTGQANDYRYHIECGVGKISLGGKTYSSLNSEKNLYAENTSAPTYDLDCDMGSISVSYVQ